MAFSSLMVFCGEKGIGHYPRGFYSTTTLILTAIFCATALLSIILYYRPPGGRPALLLVIPGIAALIYSVTTGGGIFLYDTGAFFILAGLLRNSGLWSFLERIILSKKPAF
jgi:hypothetical protein